MDWQANERHRSRLKKFTKLYARMKLSGNIDYKTLCNVYGDYKEKLPDVKVKRLLRSQTVQNMIESEILSLYESNGITPESVVNDERDILHLSFNTNDMSNARQIVHKWGARIGLDPKEVKTSISLVTTDYRKMLEGNETTKLSNQQPKLSK